jgi:glycine cleavage system H lipoate-binding protein
VYFFLAQDLTLAIVSEKTKQLTKEDIMVFVFVLLTVAVLLLVDYILRKEDRQLKEVSNQKKSPIFLSPEKSLTAITASEDRKFHQSHSWLEPLPDGTAYIGYDNFMTTLFSENVQMSDLPLVGAHIPQGTKIWDIGLDQYKIAQLSPVSGKVVDVNPACKMDVPVPSDQAAHSWIIKMKLDNLENEENNLMEKSQAALLNNALRDELLMTAQRGHYLNDGGKIDPTFIKSMSQDDWTNLISKFFPYQKRIK